MEVHIATTDAEIRRCFPVMQQLRPHLDEAAFLAQAKRQMDGGYVLAFLEEGGAVRTVAGFRLIEMLSRGHYLYVDDLVSDAAERSQGFGEAMFDWLLAYARAHGCGRLHLDSGVQRFDAHRFYFRKRMHIAAYHFALEL